MPCVDVGVGRRSPLSVPSSNGSAIGLAVADHGEGAEGAGGREAAVVAGCVVVVLDPAVLGEVVRREAEGSAGGSGVSVSEGGWVACITPCPFEDGGGRLRDRLAFQGSGRSVAVLRAVLVRRPGPRGEVSAPWSVSASVGCGGGCRGRRPRAGRWRRRRGRRF